MRRLHQPTGHQLQQTYKAVVLTGIGAPDVLRIEDRAVEPLNAGELRLRVKAAGVGATDLTMLAGNYPYAPMIPFVPGYEVAGVVDAVGAGVSSFTSGQRVAGLVVHGGYAELLVRDASHFVPIPEGVSDVDAAAVVLNFGSAWQMVHRVANVRAGQTALVTGAAGGVGSALLQVLRLAGVKAYAAASPSKHALVRTLGAIPIDYRSERVDKAVRARESGGVDYVFDAIGYANIGPCTRALRLGGLLVAYGFMGGAGALATSAMFANIFVGARLRARRGTFYGITLRYRKDPQPLRDDLAKIFRLLAERRIDPLIYRTFPLSETRHAIELLASGAVSGKLVVTTTEMSRSEGG